MSLLDVVFPAECAGCGGPEGLACPRCLAVLAGPAVAAWPDPVPPGLPPPWAVAAYADPCRSLLLTYKERGAVGLRAALAVPLAAAIRAALAEGLAAPAARGARVLVVPAPSAGRAVRTRGDDVVLVLTRLAAAIARRSGAQVRVLPALRHARVVADSAGMTAAGRAANLAEGFVVRRQAAPLLAGATVVLADDLITTGATLAESARALRAAGADVIGAATVAATQRRGNGGSARTTVRSTVGTTRVGL